MRVPIAQSDLIPNRGFKLIARALQLNWPASSPIGLMTAQDVLSRGLGYCDYHDLSREADKGMFGKAITTQTEVEDSINTAVFAYLSRESAAGNSSDAIKKAVESLPLSQLKVFSAALPLLSPCQASEQSNESDLTGLQPPEKEQPTPAARSPHSSLISPEGQIRQEVKLLWETVKQTGNLRDICLLSLMLFSGLRLLEIVEFKVGNPDGLEQQISIPIHKSRGARKSYILGAKAVGGWLWEYILKEELQPGDYLFRSKRDPASHMTAAEARRLVSKWTREAKVLAAIRSFASSLGASQLNPDLIGYMTRHVPVEVLGYYMQGYGKSSDE